MEILRPKGFDVVQMETYLERVLSIASDVIDPKKENSEEEADPYVLALALQLRRADTGLEVMTRDRKDYLDHISLATACDRLNIDHISLEEFLAALDWDPADPWLPH